MGFGIRQTCARIPTSVFSRHGERYSAFLGLCFLTGAKAGSGGNAPAILVLAELETCGQRAHPHAHIRLESILDL